MRLLFKLLMRLGFSQVGPSVTGLTTATQTEGTSLVHTVTLASSVVGTPGLYQFSLTSVTASTPSDYTATPTFSNGVTLSLGVLSVPIAVSGFTVTVPTSQDTVYEGTETYTIRVGNMTNTGTITDDESAPTVTTVSSASATEGTSIVHTVTVTGTAQAAQTYAISIGGGTATGGGTDYTSTLTNGMFSNGVTVSGGNISVPAGVTSFTVTIPTVDDILEESTETYTLTVGGASGTGTINDNDSTVAFTLTISTPVNCTIADSSGTATVTAASDLATVMSQALAGNSITGTGGITTATTGIASRTTGVAPMAVFFDATATTNSLGIDNFADILYLWNFGDTETAWTYGTGVGDNSKNRARGGVAAHVYETAGTYTAKVTPVTVSSSGTLSYGTTTSITITVNAAARSGTTYIVSNTGFTGAPAGTQVATSDIATALGSGRLAANTRFLFKGGETFNSASAVSIGVSGVTFGAWGTGKPKITHSAVGQVFTIANGVDDIIAMDWSLDATATAAGWLFWSTGADRTNVLQLRVDTNGNTALCKIGATTGLFVVDCNGYDFVDHGYGVYAEFSEKMAILGSRIDTVRVSTGEHCIRGQGTTKVVISNNSIKDPADGKHCIAIRGRSLWSDKTVWSGVWVEHVVISDNKITTRPGATWMIQLAPQDSGDNSKVRDCIIERNYIDSGTAGTAALATEGISGITVRNNLVWMSNTDIAFQVIYQSPYTTEPTQTLFYNNTIYRDTLGSTALNLVYANRQGTPLNGNNPSGTVWKNNLAAAPTLGTVVVSGGVAATVSSSTTAAQATGTAAGFTIPPTTTFTTWKATSGYSIDAGTYAPVFDDFYGGARTGTYDMGAVNP